MATTLLDVVKSKSELYDLLKQEPSSKLLRTYIKQHLGIQSIPVLVNIEEWEEWLSSQTIEPKQQRQEPQEQPDFLEDFLSLLPEEEIDASQRRTFVISGEISSTECINTDLHTLFREVTPYLRRILRPIFDCQTKEELDDLDTEDIVRDLEIQAYSQLEHLFDEAEFPKDLGELYVREIYVDDQSDIEVDGLYSLLDNFVSTVIEHRRQQLA